jgi:hypothetical protein
MIHIYPNLDDLKRILFALTKVQATAQIESVDITYRSAVDYQHLVIFNLNSQKFAGGYAPYSKKYGAWKDKLNVGMDFWKLYGDLVQNIKLFRVPGAFGRVQWIAGVDPSAIASTSSQMFGDKQKKEKVSKYARWMEYGRPGRGEGGRQPPRPLFGPTMIEYKKDGFIKQGERSLKRIEQSWS